MNGSINSWCTPFSTTYAAGKLRDGDFKYWQISKVIIYSGTISFQLTLPISQFTAYLRVQKYRKKGKRLEVDSKYEVLEGVSLRTYVCLQVFGGRKNNWKYEEVLFDQL